MHSFVPRHVKRGHYCWSCDRVRANERFSGRGHARHLCRSCAKLGASELEFRQAVRNIDRSLVLHDVIPRRKRASLERYLEHPNERVRAYVQKVFASDARRRAEHRAELELYEKASQATSFRDASNADSTLDADGEQELPF